MRKPSSSRAGAKADVIPGPAASSPALKVAIYARVSTTDQDCRMQLAELREYCGRRGWTIEREYVDSGFSGAKASRPALDACMNDAREHRFDSVIVWKLDRWGRGLVNCISSIQQLTDWGVRWISYTQNIDTDQKNPTSKLILSVLAMVAEFEREMIQERVKAGVANAKRLGKHCGRPKRIFRRDEAVELRKSGMPLRAIAASLGVGLGTVQRLLAGR